MLTPLETLFETGEGEAVALPAELARVYGGLKFPGRAGRAHVVGNFVTSLDGVVSLGVLGKEGGGEISGFDAHDQMVMGMLRAVADAVVVGAGTVRVSREHVWTAEHVFPAMAGAYRELRVAMGKSGLPLNVIVTASGEVDLGWRVFRTGEVEVLVVTTGRGARRLKELGLPAGVKVAEVGEEGRVSARGVLEAVMRERACEVVLVEGGPHLLGDFLAEGVLDEQFLTLSPQVAGRDGSAPPERPGLVMGKIFAPGRPLWGRLVGVKRGGSHLFLRYGFASAME